MSQVSIIDIEGNHPQIPTQFNANVGFAIPIGNVLEILGNTAAAGTNPVQTVGSGNTITTNVQISQAIASTNVSNVGLAAFNSAQFSVDANGFVSLLGGGEAIDSIGVDATSGAGTNPVLPTALGLITVNGAVVASGTNPLRTVSTAANVYQIQVQTSQALAAADATKIGLSNFSSTDFAVTATGFVTLSTTGAAKTITGNSGGALSPTANNWNILAAAVAAGTTPAATAGAVSTLTVNIQRTQAIASTNASNVGLAAFDSAAFDVDANGFVQLNGGGIAATSFDVQANTAPGTDPVVPTAAGVVTINGAAVANHSVVLETRSRAANAYNLEIQYATTSASTNATKSGVAHFDSTDFSVDSNGFVSLAGAGAGQTITGDSGGALPPSGGNWNIVGGAALSAGTNASVTSGSGSTLTVTSINCAKWIVDPSANRGTHTTIAGAIAAASSGETIFIRPGTYTENLTLKAGVDLVSFSSEGETPNVTIIGNATFSAAGTVTISGIRLQTNSAAFLTVSGSAASVVNLHNCYLNCSNATGISFTAANTSSEINCFRCTGNLGTTGIALYNMSATGVLMFEYCFFRNSGVSTTASSNSASNVLFNYSVGTMAFSTSGTGSFLATHSILNIGVISNTTAVTTAGTGAANTIYFCTVTSGTASAISVGSGTTLQMANSIVDSTNTNAITGAGTIVFTEISFQNTSSLINTTSQTRRNISVGGISFDGGTNTLSNYTEGTFTPTMTGGTVAGTTTYTAQAGFYRRIGNLVVVQFTVTGTGATGTGNVVFGGLPFTIKNQTNGAPQGSVVMANGATFVFPAGTTGPTVLGVVNSVTALSWVNGSGGSGIQQMVNAVFNFQCTMAYEI